MTIPNIKKWLDDLLTIFDNAKEVVTSGIKVIPTDHAKIHDGDAYICPIYVGSLGNEATLTMMFKTPENKYPHIKGLTVSTKGATIKAQVILGATVTNDGTQVSNAIIPLNHNSSNIAQSELYQSPTYTGGTDGDFIVVHGSTSVDGKTGSSEKFENADYFEYVLEPNETNYIFVLENIDTDGYDAEEIYVRLFFYEEDYGITEG